MEAGKETEDDMSANYVRSNFSILEKLELMNKKQIAWRMDLFPRCEREMARIKAGYYEDEA